jgi:hypothetical protein
LFSGCKHDPHFRRTGFEDPSFGERNSEQNFRRRKSQTGNADPVRGLGDVVTGIVNNDDDNRR